MAPGFLTFGPVAWRYGVLQHRHRDQALPRFAAPRQEAIVALVVLEGRCQTGCRQGRVGRVLSDPPQQLGQGLAGPRGEAAAGLASCGPRPRGSGRPWPAREVLGRGTPPASRQAVPAARASRGARPGRVGAGDPAGGVLSAGQAARGPSPSLRRVGDSGCGGATTGAGAATDSSDVKGSEADTGARGRAGRDQAEGVLSAGRPLVAQARAFAGWRLGLRRYHDWGRAGNR